MARSNRSVSESDAIIDNNEKSASESLSTSSLKLLTHGNSEKRKEKAIVNEHQPAPKKRRLFDPTAYEEQVIMKSTDSNDNNNTPLNEPSNGSDVEKTKIRHATPHNKRSKQRRSTMDFQTEPPKPTKVYASTMKTNSPMNYLAYTNMKSDQIKVINEVMN